MLQLCVLVRSFLVAQGEMQKRLLGCARLCIPGGEPALRCASGPWHRTWCSRTPSSWSMSSEEAPWRRCMATFIAVIAASAAAAASAIEVFTVASPAGCPSASCAAASCETMTAARCLPVGHHASHISYEQKSLV